MEWQDKRMCAYVILNSVKCDWSESYLIPTDQKINHNPLNNQQETLHLEDNNDIVNDIIY